MSQKDRQQWQNMLDADPALQAAWDGFLAQLKNDAAHIMNGAIPTGQALSEAAKAVHVAAGTDQGDD